MSEQKGLPLVDFSAVANGSQQFDQGLDPEKMSLEAGEPWASNADLRYQAFQYQGQIQRPKALSVGGAFSVPSPPFQSQQQFDVFLNNNTIANSALDSPMPLTNFLFDGPASPTAQELDQLPLALETIDSCHDAHRRLSQPNFQQRWQQLAPPMSQPLDLQIHKDSFPSALPRDVDDPRVLQGNLSINPSAHKQDSSWLMLLALQRHQEERGLHDIDEPGPSPDAGAGQMQNDQDSASSSPVSSFGSKQGRSRNSSTVSASTMYPHVVKPKIATTFWGDQNTVCYQVRARGVLVSRREDTDYINGTKLLNLIGMTRGKRDGMLKTEKTRLVIKVGSMNLKGVWIPFERAAEIARNEGVSDILYPLFIRDLKSYYQTKGYKLRSSQNANDVSRMESSESPPNLGMDESKNSIVAIDGAVLPLENSMAHVTNNIVGFENLEGLNTAFSMIRCDLFEQQPLLAEANENFRLSYYTPAQIQSNEETSQ